MAMLRAPDRIEFPKFRTDEERTKDRADGVASSDPEWQSPSYVHAYIDASRTLASAIDKERHLPDDLGLPLLFLIRHTVELVLKNLSLVAKARALGPGWLGTGVAKVVSLVERGPGLPSYFLDRGTTIGVAPNIAIRVVARQTLVSLKLLAAGPSERKHIDDLKALTSPRNPGCRRDARQAAPPRITAGGRALERLVELRARGIGSGVDNC